MKTLPLTVALAIAATALVGCGSGPDCVPVSGTIKLDGEPLAGVQVTTQPVETGSGSEDYPGSRGVTDASGKYILALVTDGREGAVVGKHAVYIAFGDDPSLVDPTKPKIPMKYWDGSLRVEIPDAGTDSLDFDLTSK